MLPVLAGGVSPSAASPSPSSPAEYFMALFGGSTKGKSARKGDGEAREAELLSAIEAVQGRGRCVCVGGEGCSTAVLTFRPSGIVSLHT